MHSITSKLQDAYVYKMANSFSNFISKYKTKLNQFKLVVSSNVLKSELDWSGCNRSVPNQSFATNDPLKHDYKSTENRNK